MPHGHDSQSGAGTARGTLPYVPAIDGVRGLAVAAVLCYHAGFDWAAGGYLGVTSFFALSGFLITALLLREHATTGRVDLRAFWGRRIRRLAPAAVVTVGVVALAVLVLGDRRESLIGDAIAATTWTANWRLISSGAGYADLFGTPPLFQHFWSLAIEEQFYLAFPLVFVALMAGRRLRRWRPVVFGGVAAAVVVASVARAASLHVPLGSIDRIYYGTDARIGEILVGVLAALVLVGPDGLRRPARFGRVALHAAGLVSLGILLAAYHLIDRFDDRLYERGGFVLVAALSAVVVMAATQTRTTLAWLLAVEPLRALGKISYGVYLLHWPVFLTLDADRTGLDQVPRFVLQCAVTLGLAVVSYRLVETPIRRGRLAPRVGLVAWANASVAGVTAIALVVSSAVVADGDAAVAAEAPRVASVDDDSVVPATTPQTAPPSTVASTTANTTAVTEPTSTEPTAPPPTAAQPAPTTTAPTTTTKPPPPEPEPIGDPTDVDESAPPPPVPTADDDDLRIAIIGDSVASNIGYGVERWAYDRPQADIVGYNLAIRACPISRGGTRTFPAGVKDVPELCGWWSRPDSARAQALVEFDPHMVVVLDGPNAVMTRRPPGYDYNMAPGFPEYHEFLIDEYRALMNTLDAKFVFLNAPCADWSRLHFFSPDAGKPRVQAMNESVYPRLEVDVLDLHGRVCPNGEFREDVEGVEGAREDGLHFIPEASVALVEHWLGPRLLALAPIDVGIPLG